MQEVKRTVILQSSEQEGIDAIKYALTAKNAEIHYLGSSKFIIAVKGKEFKSANIEMDKILVEIAKRALRLPASLGLPQGITSGIDRIQDPVFSTAVGLVAWGKEMAHHSKKKSSLDLGNVGGAFKRMFKSLMP